MRPGGSTYFIEALSATGRAIPVNNEEAFLYLTTIGRKTGIPREIEIWFTQLGGRYYLIAERRKQTHWVQNMLHHPRISFRVAGRNFHGTGRVVDETGEQELLKSVRNLSDQKYGWSDGLVVELTPDS